MTKPLMVFEMANNHMGDVPHGIATIRAIREACHGFEDDFDFAFKLQYRDLDTGKSAVVSFGLLRTKVAIDRLERVSRAEMKRQDKQMRSPSKSMGDFGEKRLTFKHEIDIRGLRAEEAMAQVRDFVEQAIVLGVSDIQILHGKGSGILRSQIRDFLKIEPMVTRFEDAHADRGGAGITVIHIG